MLFTREKHVEVFVAIAWAGTPIEPTCFSACASQTSWLLDFFDYFLVFFICRRVEPARRNLVCVRERKRESMGLSRGRDKRRFVRFVVLENRILIAWMPSREILVVIPAAKEKARTIIDADTNVQLTVLSFFFTHFCNICFDSTSAQKNTEKCHLNPEQGIYMPPDVIGAQ